MKVFKRQRFAVAAVLAVGAVLGPSAVAAADTIPAITFDG